MQIKSNNPQLSTIIDYTKQQILSRIKDIEEETTRKNFFINKYNQIKDNIDQFNISISHLSNELVQIKESKNKQKVMLKLSTFFKNLGLNLTINEEVNKISFQFMSFFKLTFIVFILTLLFESQNQTLYE